MTTLANGAANKNRFPLAAIPLALLLTACGESGDTITVQGTPLEPTASEPADPENPFGIVGGPDNATQEPAAEDEPVAVAEPEPVADDPEPEPITEPVANDPDPEPESDPMPEPDPIAIESPDPEPVDTDTPEPEPVVNEPQPEPVTQLILSPVNATSLIMEEFRPTDNLPVPWVVASMTLQWEPMPDHVYNLVYDGELAPGEITSPWDLQAEFPGLLETFDTSLLPSIRVQACVNDECLVTEPLAWTLPQLPIEAADACPDDVLNAIDIFEDDSRFEGLEPAYDSNGDEQLCYFRRTGYREAGGSIDIYISFGLGETNSWTTIYTEDDTEIRMDSELNNPPSDGDIAACLIRYNGCPTMRESLLGEI